MANSTNGNAPSGPLVGLRVLDFCSFINGAYSAMLMGDLGAEVIKVEPLTGDLARAWGPFLAGESRFFLGWNRNKRSIAVDLLKDSGLAAVYELVRRADIVVEHPVIGPLRQVGLSINFEKTPGRIQSAAPAIGQHTEEILREIGYDDARIESLKREGAIADCG